MGGIDLGTEKIEFQSGMDLSHFRRMETPAVMSAGKTGDGVHMGHLKPFLPQFFVKGFPDPLQAGGGMEIQMDLPETQLFFCTH